MTWSTLRVPSEGSREDRPHHFRPRSSENEACRRQRKERQRRPVLDWDASGTGFFRPLNDNDIQLSVGRRIPSYQRRRVAGQRPTPPGRIDHFPPFEGVFPSLPVPPRRRLGGKRRAVGRVSIGLPASPFRRSRRVMFRPTQRRRAELDPMPHVFDAATPELEAPDISVD